MARDEPDLPLRSIYGLTVASDIALPELSLAAVDGDSLPAPDLVIRRGEVPEVWQETDPLNVRSILDGSPDCLWLRIEGTVRMIMRGGREITYAIEPGCAEDAVRLFLLGSGLGGLMMQRGYVVIHGNAITLPKRRTAIVCIGDSGAGKSTTAIAMMQRGYAILADDICPIGPSWEIEPGMPRAKLWDQTAQLLNIETAGLPQVRDGDAKFNLPLGEHHCEEPRKVATFVWLVPGDVDQVQVHEVTGVEKFAVLRNNVYRPQMLVPLGLEAAHLRQLAQIATGTRVLKVVRPASGFDIDPLLDAIALLYEQAESASASLSAVHENLSQS